MSNKISFDTYQEMAAETAVFPRESRVTSLMYLTLGLTGEAGEVAEKIKKLYRDTHGLVTDQLKEDLTKELGDVLWYVSQIAKELDIDFSTVAEKNIGKLQSRMNRNKITGSGDNR